MAYVYFIKCGEYIKIGLTTKSLEQRMSGIQTGNPYPIELIAHLEVDSRDVVKAESAFHKFFSEYRHNREWFSITPEQIQEALIVVNTALKGSRFKDAALIDKPKTAVSKVPEQKTQNIDPSTIEITRNETVFWQLYKNAKEFSDHKTWRRLQPIFKANPIYKRWAKLKGL